MSIKVRRFVKLFWEGSTPVQLARYILAGGFTALTYSALYLMLVWSIFPGERAVLAVPFAFFTALVMGFFLHSRWSFAGYGKRENSGGQQGKFLIVHSAGFALNLAFTWLLTAWLGAPTWAPLIPTVTIIPIGSFVLQRQWVFA